MEMFQWAFSTGCNSIFWKIFKFKIWKKPMLVQKQKIHQQKALDYSLNLTPWKWVWHYHEAATRSRRRTTFFTLRGTMLFAARGRGALLIKPSPLSVSQTKSWNQGLSADVSFVSVLFMVLSEYWKKLEENFRKKISTNDKNYEKYFLQPFSIFWKNHK